MVSNKENIIKDILEKDIYKLKEYTLPINNGKTFFNKEDYNIIEGIPKYFEPDELGRTSGAIAIISRNTLSIRTEKHLRYPNPNGWTKVINDSGIFQRCHCIAYRLSARKNDKRNIFIGTSDLNKKIMWKIENDIENYIRENEKQYIRILYRVTPKYKGKNQIPTGVLIEAKSLDTEYELCVFCYNVEDKVKIKYADGSIKEDNRAILKTKFVEKIKDSYLKKKQDKSKNVDIVVNSQTKKYHYEDCKMLKNIDPKYIKEITTKEKRLISDGYSSCKVCYKK
jgi:DNA-entry nuclease